MVKEENNEDALDELISRHSGIYVDMLKKFGFKSLTQNQVQDIMADKDYVIYRAALEYDPSRAKLSKMSNIPKRTADQPPQKHVTPTILLAGL